MRSAFHPLLGRFRIGASRLRPLFPKLHTSDCSSACPGSSTWVDKVPSRDTPSLNLADHRKGVFPGDPQVTHQLSASPSAAKTPSNPGPSLERSGPRILLMPSLDDDSSRATLSRRSRPLYQTRST